MAMHDFTFIGCARAPGTPLPPHATPTTSGARPVHGGRYTQLLALDPLRGEVTITECDADVFLGGQCDNGRLHCEELHTQTLPSFAPGAVHSLTYLGNSLILHHDRSSGAWALRQYTRCSPPAPEDGPADADTWHHATRPPPRVTSCGISDVAIMTGTWNAGEQHTYLGDGVLLAHHPADAPDGVKAGTYLARRLLKPPPPNGTEVDHVAALRRSRWVEVSAGELPNAMSCA